MKAPSYNKLDRIKHLCKFTTKQLDMPERSVVGFYSIWVFFCTAGLGCAELMFASSSKYKCLQYTHLLVLCVSVLCAAVQIGKGHPLLI